MQNCLVVWIALARALADEILPILDEEDFAILRARAQQFAQGRSALDSRSTALAAFRFAEHLTSRSSNPELHRAIGSGAHLILIGSLELPSWLDAGVVESSLADLMDAFRSRDIEPVRAALERLSSLDVVHLAPEA